MTAPVAEDKLLTTLCLYRRRLLPRAELRDQCSDNFGFAFGGHDDLCMYCIQKSGNVEGKKQERSLDLEVKFVIHTMNREKLLASTSAAECFWTTVEDVFIGLNCEG